MRIPVFAVVLACGIATHANAGDIFKCTNDAGKVEYRDSPCSKSAQSAMVRIDAPSNPYAAADLAAVRKEYANSLARTNAEAAGRRESAPPADIAAAQQDAYLAGQQAGYDNQPSVVNNYYNSSTQVNKKVIVPPAAKQTPALIAQPARKRPGQP